MLEPRIARNVPSLSSGRRVPKLLPTSCRPRVTLHEVDKSALSDVVYDLILRFQGRFRGGGGSGVQLAIARAQRLAFSLSMMPG
jgi:hypothetical protein